MLVDHNPLTWALMVFTKFFVGYLGLLCLIYFVLAAIIFRVPGIAHPFSIFVEVVGLIEILWYLLWFLPFKAYLQRPGLPFTPLTEAERRALITKALQYIPDFPLFLRKWFNNAHLDEIYRDDLKDWLIWGLWGSPPNNEGVDPDELEEYVKLAEEKGNMQLPAGRAGAKPILLNTDPVRMRHRSLLWFGLVYLLDVGGALIMMFIQGFRFYRQPVSEFLRVFPLRPHALLSPHASAAPNLSYWCRPHRSKVHRPVVFCHGVGIGMPTYVPWFQTLPEDVGVIAVEFLSIANRICREAQPPEDFVAGMRQILAQQGWDDFVFVGHSYGTFMIRLFLQDPTLNPMVNSILLCDPVSILIHMPEVAYNITRRKPKLAPHLEIWVAAGSDPRTAHTVCRRFHWPKHILWREDLAGKRTTAVVASRDCVTCPDAVASYLYYGDVNYTKADLEALKDTPSRWTGQGALELVYLYGRDHGQSLLIPAEMRRVTSMLEKYCRKDGTELATYDPAAYEAGAFHQREKPPSPAQSPMQSPMQSPAEFRAQSPVGYPAQSVSDYPVQSPVQSPMQSPTDLKYDSQYNTRQSRQSGREGRRWRFR